MRTGADRLLERAGELERLRGRLDAAASGHGAVLVVEGPAGVGKTALLQACREQAREAGLRVLWGSAGSLEGELSWGVVQQLFAGVIAAGETERAGLMRGAASLAAGPLGLVGGATRPGGAFHGLYWLAVALGQEHPLLVAVDDAHWADQPSLGFLAYLGARVADLPVCVVVSVRRGEPEPEALSVLTAGAVEVIRVRELTAAGSAELVRDGLGAGAADVFCGACHRATGGNPFLLRELLSELARDRVDPSAKQADVVASITPESVRRSVLLRLARLPDPARELADAVAILGDGTRLSDAARLTGLDGTALAGAADALEHTGILAHGATPAFAHPLVREVIYRALPAHQRALRHRQAAQVLSDAGADPERVAAQLLLSEPAADAWVVERLRDAAVRALAGGDASAAADLLERAVDEPPGEADRAELLLKLGRARLAAGRPEATARLHEAVELCAEPADRAGALLDLGRALYVVGQPLGAAAALERGLRELDGAGPEHRSLAGELQAAWVNVARIEAPLRARASEVLHEIAKRPPAGETYGERALLAEVAGQLTFQSEPRDRALELARLALADGELLRQETSDGMAWVAAMGALGWGDDFEGYEALQRQALEDARRRGSVIGFATASYGYSFSHYYRGMLSDAVADAQQAIASERDGWRQFLPAARAQLAWALIDRGELDEAMAELHRARSDASWPRSSMQALVFEAQARIHLARAQPEPALRLALDAGRVFEQALIPNPSIVPWRSRAAIAAFQLGQRDRAQQLLEEELALAQRFGAPRPIGVALVATGVIRGKDGVDALEHAVQALAASPAQLEHARALVHLGAALRRRGHRKDARVTLRSGLQLCERFGAWLLAQRARTELAAAGGRIRRSAESGAASLTPAELRVATLAAEGLSNREIAQALFVSLRTVETHLTHAYQKLDLDSRAQLATALETRRMQAEPADEATRRSTSAQLSSG